MLGLLAVICLKGFPSFRSITFDLLLVRFSWRSANPYFVRAGQGPDLASLPDLTQVPWPTLHRPLTSNPRAASEVKAFGVTLSAGHRKTITRLLDAFQKAMVEANLNDQWFLLAGTLIGSVRHHDIVPWDEDVDIGMDVIYRERVTKILKRLAPEIEFHKYGDRDKINFKPLNESFSNKSDVVGSFKVRGVPWAWPFVDIWYHANIANRMAVSTQMGSFRFRLDDVYPLTYRPLGKRWYPAPNKPVNFLMTYYRGNPLVCNTGDYSHPLERFKRAHVKDCQDLLHEYAFVHRCPHSFIKPRNETAPYKLLDSLVYADEHLLNGKGEIIHTLRTIISLGGSASSGYSAEPKNFVCPIRV